MCESRVQETRYDLFEYSKFIIDKKKKLNMNTCIRRVLSLLLLIKFDRAMCCVQNGLEHATTAARTVKHLEKIQRSSSGPLKRDESSDLGSYNVDKLMCRLKLSSARQPPPRRSGGSNTYKRG